MRIKVVYLLALLLIAGCKPDGYPDENNLANKVQDTLALGKSLFGETPYLRGDEALILLDRFSNYENYIGTDKTNMVHSSFGIPLDSLFVENGLSNGSVWFYYYDYPLSDYTHIYLQVAVQDNKVVGLQLSSQPNGDLVYSSARFYIASRGGEWSNLTEKNSGITGYAAFQNDTLVWQIGYVIGYAGRNGVVNIGTIPYANSGQIWNTETFWGEDGIGVKTRN